MVVAALLLVDLAALGPSLRALHPRTRPSLTVKGSLRSGGACTLAALGPPRPLTVSLSGPCSSGKRGQVQERDRTPLMGVGQYTVPDPRRSLDGPRPLWSGARGRRVDRTGACVGGPHPGAWTLPSADDAEDPRKWNPGWTSPLLVSRQGGRPMPALGTSQTGIPGRDAGRRSDQD